ncbi:MAG TPA: hypothetical protein DIT97_04750 [Gimesia maris]|uniref:Uncharacterized protein n=1 Tax=Gimesia maris TaxID=122 RepID=A0A3D3R486_9PLAN|nr:hypothetical protein [Gimesia maris]
MERDGLPTHRLRYQWFDKEHPVFVRRYEPLGLLQKGGEFFDQLIWIVGFRPQPHPSAVLRFNIHDLVVKSAQERLGDFDKIHLKGLHTS